jgi:hypothetical protein
MRDVISEYLVSENRRELEEKRTGSIFHNSDLPRINPKMTGDCV